MKRAFAPRLMGRHIVTNPKICHGKPTFRGTRVLVSDVLEQVASGVAWETIIEEWNHFRRPNCQSGGFMQSDS